MRETSPVRTTDLVHPCEAKPQETLDSALRTLSIEIEALYDLKSALQQESADDFCRAHTLIRSAKGRVIVTGMGKSGHVGSKLAATLASTGTPAFFLHPSEASHGDLGMVTAEDVLLALSWSGETQELHNVIDYSRRFQVPLIGVTARRESALGRAADITLALPQVKEACPHGLAPTSSTLLQLALGDALAIALLESTGFTAQDFKIFHPGGQLGAQLRHVRDIMHTGPEMPLAMCGTVMSEALVVMTEKSFGCLGITDSQGHLIGIITDGDLRRHMQANLLDQRVDEVMTPDPQVVHPELLAAQALERLNSAKHTALFVTDGRKPVGILHIHDLLRAGVA